MLLRLYYVGVLVIGYFMVVVRVGVIYLCIDYYDMVWDVVGLVLDGVVIVVGVWFFVVGYCCVGGDLLMVVMWYY